MNTTSPFIPEHLLTPPSQDYTQVACEIALSASELPLKDLDATLWAALPPTSQLILVLEGETLRQGIDWQAVDVVWCGVSLRLLLTDYPDDYDVLLGLVQAELEDITCP